MSERHLTVELAREKCRLGQGAACCSYLTVDGGGFECCYVNPPFRIQIDKARFGMTAIGGPCADPYDDTSEAKLPSQAWGDLSRGAFNADR
jgi:hypothetical protein